ncbi:unnamed protein product [Aspergillus oryzae var. brunneus]|uniref:Unnamed protein product n=1 Tax=Aspergillus oryzae var. brunneus TaxID=332754 RepID=A0ABQ6L118_ASPOZ|nr:unnamed protein product [Aspergillus oryzae var. brunneus]
MADTPASLQTGWRISKACQECRKRKIKCNGSSPCKTCHLRNTPCIYRDVIRQRKRKHQTNRDSDSFESEVTTRSGYGAGPRSPGLPSRRNPSNNYTINNSVSATHVESPSCKVQLYYGSTSNFALMHEIYRDLVSNQTPGLEKPHGEVEEARASLDMFSFRRIFFGTPDEPKESIKSCKPMDMPVMFLPRELANLFLRRFLSTLYTLIPFRSKESFEQQLEHLYNPVPGARSETWGQCMLLLALATGALGTEHYRWGDVLYDQVKATCGPLDDIVNLETVQLSLLMISAPFYDCQDTRGLTLVARPLSE